MHERSALPSARAREGRRGALLLREVPTGRQYLEVVIVITVVTVLAWLVPVDYRVFGDIYLLVVIALSLRVKRGAILFATVLSVLAWNFAIVPPRLSFSELDLKDSVFLGAYFIAALLAGQLTARIRAQQQRERQREQRATALFHLTRSLSAARNQEEAVIAALRHADTLFEGRTALLLATTGPMELSAHPASSLALDAGELAIVRRVAGGDGALLPSPGSLVSHVHIPLRRPSGCVGVFSVGWDQPVRVSSELRDLLETFAAQIALAVERERLREASEREKLLAESERLHRTLLDSVSHELKTPIAVLRSVEDNFMTDDPVRREKLAGETRMATDRLDRLVGNLLNQSRLEAGVLSPKMDWCDARDIIGSARQTAAASLAGHPLQVEIPHDMPILLVDFMLMEQVLINLLVNAAVHTPAGTPITVSTGFDAHRVFICVSDRGPGIDPELKQRLFQKFQRGGLVHPGGLGLGLSIVRGFMQAQGGDVQVDAEPDGGTRFTLRLPYVSHEDVPQE